MKSNPALEVLRRAKPPPALWCSPAPPSRRPVLMDEALEGRAPDRSQDTRDSGSQVDAHMKEWAKNIQPPPSALYVATSFGSGAIMKVKEGVGFTWQYYRMYSRILPW